ncbi:serine/threonine-protein kinase [Actinomarinicola tropica]|uniref:non-specific serine/threonine protein kinase n=1 Tax=Actinomarinicola tropica TaxID=2789776 RepID=A0A5Q2RFQ2_9ACTN|nr:serine/threonine-protein kinase [Actinomarinicola tropica]QGG93632.1 protein kinase [Actinomarinicola tropica]
MADAPPPDIPGYDVERELGHGGFADVFLYRQRLPSRLVAVKVLRQTASSPTDRAQFEDEANRMAMLSSHPGIVTIYEVGVSADDRPYISMEYCPHDHFGRIVRAHPLTTSRALEVGIKVAAAVETAHRAGILHRDVKPANVLLTTYGEPALTDFGIAGGIGAEAAAASQGVSIPFAAPEVLNGSTDGDALSDVYSLGATVYALLAGRAPFSTGEQMSEAEAIQRVLHAPLPPTGRADVPPSLERVLAHALARDPANRYDSAAAFGRALQGIEAELGLAQTPLRITEATSAPPPAPDLDDDDSTRFRAVQRVDPDAPARPAVPPVPDRPPSGAAPAAPPWRVEEALPADGGLGDRTIHRGSAARADHDAPAATDDTGADSGRRPWGRIVLLAASGLVVVGGVAALLSAVGGEAEPPGTTTPPDTSPLVVSGVPGRPDDVTITVDDAGGQLVTWSTPGAEDGDTYQVFFTDGPEGLAGESRTTAEPELRIEEEEAVCLTVEAIRGGRVSAASTEVCTP